MSEKEISWRALMGGRPATLEEIRSGHVIQGPYGQLIPQESNVSPHPMAMVEHAAGTFPPS